MKRRFVIRNREIAERAAEFVRGLPVQERPLEVVVRPYRSKRTLEQNAYYWRLIADIAHFIGDDKESVALEMKARFLEPVKVVDLPDGSKAAVYPSSADMTVGELAEFCEKIEAWAVHELGFRRAVA
ncbi:MAG: recombination protein NinB [Mariprofundaceae bacterium]